ncbi:retropepsin-like aspartic protease [Brevundimonas sp.]|uniref:retropepsin-like aspartic protease n=1 Tax=Brevundimonas sp. TaxID=1871086 RepID=UPI001A26C8C3|nr:retropepsin-like aspartic protease [Brevundimonas sp.]MBJ7486500.1 retropepsin-like domain-containing protein [Brevundimonas sp.]
MIERTPQTRDEPGREGIDRRLLLGGGALLLTGLDGPAFAQQADASPTPQREVPPPDALSLSPNILTRMAAAVRLNRRRPNLFVLDTGAERTSIARDLAEALGLPSGPTVVVHGITSAQATPTVRVDRLTFGRQRFNDLVMPVFERSLLAADGLLGLDVLSQFRLSMNLADRTVNLTSSSFTFITRGSASIIPTRLQGGTRARADVSGQLILTNALADGVPVQSFVDSGGQYSIGNMALLRAIGGQVGSRPIPLYGVTGQTIDAHAGRLNNLQIGRHQLGPTPLLFADLHAFQTLGLDSQPALLIGADVLYRFRRVELDYGSRRMAFSGLQPRRTPSAVER